MPNPCQTMPNGIERQMKLNEKTQLLHRFFKYCPGCTMYMQRYKPFLDSGACQEQITVEA